MDRFVVAVDGPSGSGKSTVSRRLAGALGARYLDTGAMYRAVTWAVLRAGIDPYDADAVAKVAGDVRLTIAVDPDRPTVSVDGTPVDREIRGPEVTAAVSAVAALPMVRRQLVAQQRELIAAADRIVVEGRDIGSVVFPDAVVKVFLTASAAERARRRNQDETPDDLARRDLLDSTRAVSPLVVPAGATVVDTTGRPIDDVVDEILALVPTDR